MSFPTETFNGVWCNFVLLHLKRSEILSVLKRIYKILNQGGILFLSTKEGKGEIIEKEHLDEKLKMFETFFKQNELMDLVKKAGFKILKSKLDTDRKESAEKIIIIYAIK